MKVFSFVAPEAIKTFEQDLRPFFDHITDEQDFPADEQHLISTIPSHLINYSFFGVLKN